MSDGDTTTIGTDDASNPEGALGAQRERLVDRFGRVVDYVRISVTDRCNFRCVYCMEPDAKFVARPQVLTLEEIALIARAFVELGVHKIRLTGGEPLVRRNIVKLMGDLATLPGLRELVITTNGSRLEHLAAEIRAAGVKRLNISLDSLDAERFAKITRGGRLSQVLAGIEAARAAGFERLKINAVILKHRNHDEVVSLVRYAAERGMDISFIEEMPLGVIHDHDRAESYYSSDEILRDLSAHYSLVPTTETTGGPSRYYRLVAYGTRVGFISPHSHNFCSACNRVRLTTEGRLLLCLGQEHSVDLRAIARTYPGDLEKMKVAIRNAMPLKPLGHDFSLTEPPVLTRHMNVTGG